LRLEFHWYSGSADVEIRRARPAEAGRAKMYISHQGLGNRLIIEEEPYTRSMGAIQCRERLGGMLNYYYRQAA
jgi:hypothetical protein